MMILSNQYVLMKGYPIMLTELQERFPGLFALISTLFNLENILALIIALILISIYIATAADTPVWLYQGF